MMRSPSPGITPAAAPTRSACRRRRTSASPSVPGASRVTRPKPRRAASACACCAGPGWRSTSTRRRTWRCSGRAATPATPSSPSTPGAQARARPSTGTLLVVGLVDVRLYSLQSRGHREAAGVPVGLRGADLALLVEHEAVDDVEVQPLVLGRHAHLHGEVEDALVRAHHDAMDLGRHGAGGVLVREVPETSHAFQALE